MTGVVNTGSVPKALQVGVNKFWGLGYREREPLQLSEIFDTETTDKAYEEDVQLVGTGLFPIKAEGAPIAYDTIRQGWVKRYNQVTYAMGIVFTWEILKYKQYDLGFKRARFLGYSMRQTQESSAANVFNRGFNASYVGGDNKSLFAADHPNISGGTFRNIAATPADLSHASLEQALIDIDSLTDDRGLQIASKAAKLIVPKELRFEAARILESTLESGTANNDKNVLKGMLPYYVNNYLTDPDAWFIITDVPGGMRRFVSEPVGAPVMENDFDTRNIKFASFFSEAYGWSDPRGVYANPGA